MLTDEEENIHSFASVNFSEWLKQGRLNNTYCHVMARKATCEYLQYSSDIRQWKYDRCL